MNDALAQTGEGVADSWPAPGDIARHEAEFLLSFVMHKTRNELYLNPEAELTAEEIAAMMQAVEERQAGKPLQHITGSTSFWNMTIKTSPAALIPRPETETLIEVARTLILKKMGAGPSQSTENTEIPTSSESMESPVSAESTKVTVSAESTKVTVSAESTKHPSSGNQIVRIADIGTGTGVIALALAKELLAVHITPSILATDISSEALQLAQENTRAQNLSPYIHFLKSDLFQNFPDEAAGTFDALVSNPPYLLDDDLQNQVPKEVVDFEPNLALAGGKDGLNVFRRLLQGAPRWLKDGGIFCVELSENNIAQAAELLGKDPHWTSISITKDLTERPRVLSAQYEK